MQPIRFAAFAIYLAVALQAQSPQMYPFSFDQDDLHGAPDFSSLNHPLTASDRVFVRNGHFYTVGPDLAANTADDRRIRFYGVNLAFGANFPVRVDAPRIAKRLRRLGVNLVRLHHMDSTIDPSGSPSNANGILLDGPYPTFNEISVERLRDFLTALAAEGIYANLNLHVGYLFRPAIDLVPALPGLPMPTQSKPLHIFHPRMVDLQRQFTEQLLRKLQLRNDPVLAMVEVNNESSLMQAWQWGQLDPALKGEYREELQSQWNRWLVGRYGGTAALAAAWGTGEPEGPDLLTGRWTLEQSHGKAGVLTMTTTDGIPTARVDPGQGSGWLFLKQTGFHVAAGARYGWTFQARADVPAGQTVNVPVSVMRDVSPWDGFLYSNITLRNEWQTFTIAVTPSFPIDDSGRVSLDVQYSPGAVYARSMKLAVAGQRGLAAGESLEQANVNLLGPGDGATPPRMADHISFLVSADRRYLNALRDTVRAGTDSLVPITGTQMGYGGLSILDSQDGLDYQDNHFYIDHYNFPNTAWDGFDWRIRDSAAADNAWSSFTDMAWAREAGRPYTVSEYNQPWPNTHAAEIDPSLAAFGAFQDWDGIMHFAYSHGRGWDDGVPNGFNINGDWTKFAVIGQSAWLFRTGAVRSGAEALSVPVSAEQRNLSAQAGLTASAWVTNRARIPREMAFIQRVQLGKDLPAALTTAEPGLPPPYLADTRELTFDRDRKLLLLDTPTAAGVFGQIGRSAVTAGPLDVHLGPDTRTFATVLLTSRDDQPVRSSRRLLLSIPGYSLRSQPGSTQPQALRNYPGTTDWWTIQSSNTRPSGNLNGGNTPTYMEKVEAWITLRTNASSISVSALNGAGEPVAEVKEIERVTGGFRIHLAAPSPWYLITAVQRERPRPKR
jgi:hypothetical protein